MLNKFEHDKLLHCLKRAAKVLTIVRDETEHEKRQLLISLLVDELDRMAQDCEEITEKEPKE